MVGYNVQTAMDTTAPPHRRARGPNVGHDRAALASMASKAQEGLGRKGIGVIADRGYYKGPEILDAEKAGVQTYIPKPMTSGAKAEGRFSKADFVYDAKADEYRCPAGQTLRRRADQVDGEGMVLHSYARYGCSDCPMKAQRTQPASDGSGAGSMRTFWTTCSRGRPEPQRDEDPTAHRRARLRNTEALDGVDALPDENIEACAHGSLACTCWHTTSSAS